jgi:glycosyltransferase involved in cell wall biosynthesis
MTILVNAVSTNTGGGVTYLENVLRWSPEVAPHHRWIVYVPSPTRERLNAIVDLSSVELRDYPHASTNGARRVHFDQVQLPRIARRESADVLFSSTGFGTFWGACPEVLLVPNMKYFDAAYQARCREMGRSFAATRLRRWYSLLSIRRTDTVLYPTEAMRTAVKRYVHLNGKHESVIHYGVNAKRLMKNSSVSSIPASVRDRKEDGGVLLLNVSSYAVHKNLETIVEALPALRRACPKVTLVTTTSRDHTSYVREYDALKDRAQELGVDDAWVEVGYLSQDGVYDLYRAADVFVFPSLIESFGFPMVEAMASGLPVVAADTEVNREVCGSAGRYFHTYDPKDCARAVLDVLGNPEGRAAMKTASFKRGRQFSWPRYTKQLVDTLKFTAALR